MRKAVILKMEGLEDITILSSKGQIVIPKATRAKLGLLPGERFLVVLTEAGLLLQRFEEKTVPSGVVSSAPARDHSSEVPAKETRSS